MVVTTPQLATRTGSLLSVMAAVTTGRMQEFNPDVRSVSDRFQLFVAVNRIANNKLVPTLLIVVGLRHYSASFSYLDEAFE